MRAATDRNTAENQIEGRNAVLEAIRGGAVIDRIYIIEDIKDGPLQTILREADRAKLRVDRLKKDRLDKMSVTGKHQGVIAKIAAFEYAEVDDILRKAEERGEKPFVFILDGIEDPHNLGAIIRSANQAGAHGVIIPKNRACTLTATVAKTSAGALSFTPVAKVTNINRTMDELKAAGMWFVCADMEGDSMYDLDMSGAIGLVIGSEGSGVSRLVKENCDMCARIPMYGDIDSLNASVAAGIMGFEIARQRHAK